MHGRRANAWAPSRSGSRRHRRLRRTLPPARSTAPPHSRSAEGASPRVARSGWFGTVDVIGGDLQRALLVHGAWYISSARLCASSCPPARTPAPPALLARPPRPLPQG
eukprot:1475160-Prymnesium_polylepis.1